MADDLSSGAKIPTVFQEKDITDDTQKVKRLNVGFRWVATTAGYIDVEDMEGTTSSLWIPVGSGFEDGQFLSIKDTAATTLVLVPANTVHVKAVRSS